MMGMTDSGHTIHAKSMIDETFHLAWGKLPDAFADPWSLGDTPPSPYAVLTTSTLTRGATPNGFETLPHLGVTKIVSVKRGGTTYTLATDYTLNANRVDWAPGGTEPANGETYDVTYWYTNSNLQTLLSEIGRREPTIKSYAIEDAAGDITANSTTWSQSATPTRHIYLQFKFDAEEAVGSIIHQLGLFIGTTRKVEIPGAKKYLLPSEIQDDGDLYMIENIEPFSRYAGKREIFEYIITF